MNSNMLSINIVIIMLSINIVIVLQFVSLCWCRSIPPEGAGGTQRATMSPRQLWDRLKTVDTEDEAQKSVEYSRVEPVSRKFGTSPSALYLIEAYREIQDSENTAAAITGFSASVFEDINQIQLTRPMYQHIYRLVLSRAALREHYSTHTEATLWIPLYNHELVRQLNKSDGDSIRVCLGHKERRRNKYCYSMDTRGLELTSNGHTWIGLGIGELARREVENRSNKKNLYLYFSLSGCHTESGRCNSVSYMGPQYLSVLNLSNPRVPFLILRSPSVS